MSKINNKIIVKNRFIQGAVVISALSFQPFVNAQVSAQLDPPPQVCFYEHDDYAGLQTCFDSTQHTVGSENDIWSSVKVPSGSLLTLFEHDDYGGKQWTLYPGEYASLSDYYFNDIVSSFSIDPLVCFYDKTDFQGTPSCYSASHQSIGKANDSWSSVTVPVGYKLTIYQDDHYNGSSAEVNAAGQLRLANINFDNKVSSFLLTKADKTFNEYSWVGAHNAHASQGYVFAIGYMNQWLDIPEQLRDHNVRSLLIDIRYEDGRVELTHSTDNAGEFIDRMNNEIVPFLKANPDVVLTFDVEVTNNVLTKDQLKEAMDQMPEFTAMMFDPRDPVWDGKQEWPTLEEMAAANQRILLYIDKYDVSGDYGDYYVLYRKDVTMENMWAVTDYDSCEERHKYGVPTVNILGHKTWSRLFSMNHFPNVPHSGIAASDNNWDGLYPRIIDTCMPATLLDKKPNFIAVDFIEQGDVQEITEVLNEGGVIFYEGNGATQNIVCGIGGDKTRYIPSGEHGCENDEARSAKLVDVQAGTTIVVYDSPSGNTNDDYTVIQIKHNLSEYVIDSFESNVSNAAVNQWAFHNNGLDGKISYFEVFKPGDYEVTPEIMLYEGNNATQNIVCTLNVYDREFNFKNSGSCDNDETRSAKLVGVSAGTQFTVYDSPNGDTGDDYTQITVLQDILGTYDIDSYEDSYSDDYVRVNFHRHNGLDGKVSRIKISAP
ncbi:hypothetical protein PE36_19980 [Moritella sp. PE36]|uniref:peptidase inhibitor family I36 protein n=1 Tax=Moritella sp. PE36 TaxID=58051 RepID=UPI00015686C0|nr:peptidase inhibitor family I36 protein [Moritella sp. PE36]EDM68919.1 hypothetical protein PE36_19980 [Moritella sp. PE36]